MGLQALRHSATFYKHFRFYNSQLIGGDSLVLSGGYSLFARPQSQPENPFRFSGRS